MNNTKLNEFMTSIVVITPSDTTGIPVNATTTLDYNTLFNVTGGNPNANTTLVVDLNKLMAGFGIMQQRELLLIEAVRNYIRKLNFNELSEALDKEVITQEQFDNEIEQHEDKYVIALKNIDSPEKVENIVDLVNEIGYDLRSHSVSEVAEMFSVDENQLLKHIQSLKLLSK